MFFVNGAAIGVWVAQIPFVQHRFDLAKSTLGLILLTMSIGVIVALPVMGRRSSGWAAPAACGWPARSAA